MNDLDKLQQTLREHIEKYPGINSVTFPMRDRSHIQVLTPKGERLLANEGLCGTVQIQQLQERIVTELEKNTEAKLALVDLCDKIFDMGAEHTMTAEELMGLLKPIKIALRGQHDNQCST